MTVQLIIAILGLAGTILGFLIKWYFGKKQKEAEALAALKKAEADSQQAAEDQKKNQKAINDSIGKQMDTADTWKGEP